MSTGNNLEDIYNNSIKILKDLIAFKTVSGEDNNQLIDYCDDILSSLGASSFKTYDDEKKRVNLFSTLKAKKNSNKKPIILSGHTDVVPVSKGWATDPFDATIKEDKLFGRGSCDMKGFIACALAYAPIFSSSNLDRDIHFSFTFDEETACKGAPILITELKKRGIKDCICIVGEPTNMKIIDAHKGCYEYTTYFEGLAGHSSEPDKGVSAVEFAARYVNKLLELKEKLKEITKQEKETNNSITAIQLKSKNWYGLKIQEQILASENKDLFLQKENFQIQKKIAQKHNKMKNSLEKASLHKKIEQEVAEKKHLLSVPLNNKSTVK